MSNYSAGRSLNPGGTPSLDGEAMSSGVQPNALEQFLDKYQINSQTRGNISLNLGGSSREEFIVEALAIYRSLTDRKLVSPDFIQEIRLRDDFTKSGGGRISIEANPKDSHLKSIKARVAEGDAQVSVADATTAFVAYELKGLLTHRQDLFGGRAGQAQDGFLFYHENTGLYRYSYPTGVAARLRSMIFSNPDEAGHKIVGMRYTS